MIYNLKYQDSLVARVDISNSKNARTAIKEMVEFWMGWTEALAQANGDYTRCFLRRLTNYMLKYGRLPRDEEGWYSLDGSYGIEVIDFWPWDFDSDQITVEVELVE